MDQKDDMEDNFDDSPINPDDNFEFPEFDVKSKVMKKSRSKIGASMLDSIEMLLRNSIMINGKSMEGNVVPVDLEKRLSKILQEPEFKDHTRFSKNESDILNDLSALQELMVSRSNIKFSFSNDSKVDESSVLNKGFLASQTFDEGKETDANEYFALIEKILDGIEEDKTSRRSMENENGFARDSIILGESYNFKAKEKK